MYELCAHAHAITYTFMREYVHRIMYASNTLMHATNLDLNSETLYYVTV